MKTHTLRVPEPLYEALRVKAEADSRSINSMGVRLLTLAVAGDIRVEPTVQEPWPQEAPVQPEPSRAEKEYATGDPVEEPVEDPEAWVEPEPLFVPVARVAAEVDRRVDEMVAEHFRPDPKPGKKK